MDYEHDRRKDDHRISQFMGEMAEWKEQSIEWRKETDKRLLEIVEFMEEVRTPRKIILWTIRAVIVSAVGGIGTALFGLIRGHVKFQ